MITFDSSIDVLLALLYLDNKIDRGQIKGTTRLTKIMFLIQQETSLKKYMTNLHFDNYNYGVFSSDLYDSILTLIQLNLIKVVESKLSSAPINEVDRFEVEQGIDCTESSEATLIYSLTPTGEKVGSILHDMLTREEKMELWKLKSRYQHMGMSHLIHYTYLKYPKESGIT